MYLVKTYTIYNTNGKLMFVIFDLLRGMLHLVYKISEEYHLEYYKN